MHYKALLLDFYGTLVAEDDLVIAALLAEIAALSPVSSDARQIGRDWNFHALCQSAYGADFQTQRALETASLRLLLERYQVDLNADAMAERLFAHWQAPAVFEDAARFLNASPLPVCVVSNIDTADLRAACAHAGWKFDFMVTSESCRSYKPRPEMFRCALDLMGCHAREAVHVGDSLSSDVKGAQAAGIDVVWVNRTHKPLPNGMAAPACTISRLDAFPFVER